MGPWLPSIGWVLVSASDSFSCLLGLPVSIPPHQKQGQVPGPPLEWDPNLGPSLDLLSLIFVPAVPSDRAFDYGLETPLLDVLSLHWRWTLQVPSPHCRAFHPRSLPLSPERVSPPGSLVHSRGSPYLQLPRLPVLILSAGPQSCSSPTSQLFPFTE